MKYISVIIPFYNQPYYTKLCISSLKEHTGLPYELVLVDNGSSEPIEQWLNDSGIKCKLIKNIRNEGAPRAFNKGMEGASGDYFVFLNNDVLLTPLWLENLIQAFESNKGTAIAGPWINPFSDPSGSFPDVAGYRSKEEINRTAALSQLIRGGKIKDVAMVTSTCMLTSREVIGHIGRFDENYGLGTNDDHDFCLRVRLAGYRIICVLDSFVFHFKNRTLGDLGMEELDRKNREYFVSKFGRKGLEYLAEVKQPYGSRGERPFEEKPDD